MCVGVVGLPGVPVGTAEDQVGPCRTEAVPGVPVHGQSFTGVVEGAFGMARGEVDAGESGTGAGAVDTVAALVGQRECPVGMGARGCVVGGGSR